MPQSISLLTRSEWSLSSIYPSSSTSLLHRHDNVSSTFHQCHSQFENIPIKPHHSLGVPSHWSIPARVRLQDLAIIQLLSSVGSVQATPFLVGTNSLKHPQGSLPDVAILDVLSSVGNLRGIFPSHLHLLIILKMLVAGLEPSTWGLRVRECYRYCNALPRETDTHIGFIKVRLKYNFVPSILFYQILYIL